MDRFHRSIEAHRPAPEQGSAFGGCSPISDLFDLSLSDEKVDIVGGGFDLALRIGVLADSSLRARRVRAVTIYVVASPAYLAVFGTPTHPDDLAAHCCLCYALLPTPDVWHFAGPGGAQVAVRPSGSFRVNNGDAMLPALRAGLGIAFLPDFIVGTDLDSGALTALLPEWYLPEVALHLVSPPGILPNYVFFCAKKMERRTSAKNTVTGGSAHRVKPSARH